LLREIEKCNVVVLRDPGDLVPYLLRFGYSRRTANETIDEVRHLAEFTIDHRFPIFVNATSPHVKRILSSWQRGKFPDEAARVMAADLYHEYLHAAEGMEECAAVRRHLKLMQRWRNQGLLHIADPYIANKALELNRLNCHAD